MNTLPQVIRLGTRGSLLARTQSGMVAEWLRPFLPGGCSIELVTIVTSGDRQQEGRLQDSGGKGLFVKELDEAMMEGRVDFTVHSAKDLPAPDGRREEQLVIAAVPKREDPRDVWVGREGVGIEGLPSGAVVGTASLRRQAQLLGMREDLKVVALRGNIDTRLRKVREGFEGISGTFLAAAGLNRTGLMPAEGVLLGTDRFIPAAGQGILAIEARRGDGALIELLRKIHDETAAACLELERRVIGGLAGNCLAPIGVCAEAREKDPGWIVRAIVASPDGKRVARATLMSHKSGREALLGMEGLLMETLRGRGAWEILGN